MSKCICERSCGENRTNPDCPVCKRTLEILRDNKREKTMQSGQFEVTYAQLSTKLKDACALLRECANQFKYYEMNHREKMIDPKITREKLLETFDKAKANATFVKMIEDKLNELETR